MELLLSRRRALLLLVSSIGAAGAGMASASAGDVESYVKGIGDQVLALANGNLRGKPLRSKFAGLLGKHVNLRGITLASLGTYQKQLPPGDKEKLDALVTIYAAALFAWYADDFKGQAFVVDRAASQGGFTIVHSKITKSGAKADEPIIWYLKPAGDSYRIVDLSVLGVRLSSAMRERFSQELKKSKGDFESLYAMLREAETW